MGLDSVSHFIALFHETTIIYRVTFEDLYKSSKISFKDNFYESSKSQALRKLVDFFTGRQFCGAAVELMPQNI